MRPTLAPLIAVTLAGCVHYHSFRLGPPEPPHPLDCPIQLVDHAPEELLDRYRRVGTVCVASEWVGPDATPHALWASDSAREQLTALACRLGGEIVAPSASCSAERASGVEFAVMRAR